MRGTSSCFTAQLPCSTNATSRPQSRQPRCQSSLKPVLPSWPSQLSLSHDPADWRCFTAALDREVISAEAPQDDFVNRKSFPAPAAGVLQDNATLFVEEHRIRAYEVGADQKTTISTIANLLQVLTCSLAGVTCSESVCWIMCELGYRK
jgi:hypothetical protein